MAENSKIEWTDHTFNPWIGCTKVSPACDHCYAEALATRYGWVEWGAGEARKRTSEANWHKPIVWNRKAEAEGIRRRVFCASLADVFDAEVADRWRLDLMQLIHATPSLDWLLLTKRPQFAKKFFLSQVIPSNVWLGTTVENQGMADLRIPVLLSIPAKVHFLSCEPLLGPIDLTALAINGDSEMDALTPLSAADHWRSEWAPEVTGTTLQDAIDGFEDWGFSYPPSEAKAKVIDWVIAGGESGAKARPSHPDWFRALRDQCQTAGVNFFMKQMTAKAPIPADLLVREFPRSAA